MYMRSFCLTHVMLTILPTIFGDHSFTTFGSLDGDSLFLCHSSASFVCKSTSMPLILDVNGLKAVTCYFGNCTSEDIGNYTFGYSISENNTVIVWNISSIGAEELNKIFICQHDQHTLTKIAKAVVYPSQSQSEMTAETSNDRVNFTVTTGCILQINKITFIWQKTKNKNGSDLTPFTAEDATYWESNTTDNKMCIPRKNCGGNGLSKTLSFKAGTAGESFYIYCTIVVNNNTYPNLYNNNVTLISNRTFQLIVPVSFVNLTVTKSDQTDEKLTLEENKTATVICTTSYSRPSADITFYGLETDMVIRNCRTISDDDGMISTTCNFTFVITRRFDKSSIYCNVTNMKGMEMKMSETVILNVLYPPKEGPDIQNVTKNISVIETHTYSLTCLIGKSNPATYLTWNCDGSKLSAPTTGNEAVLVWSANRTTKSMCSCYASYLNKSWGMTEIRINTLYPVSFTQLYVNGTTPASQSSVIKVIENTSLSIKWDADGNPQPQFFWSSLNTNDQVLTLTDVPRTADNRQYELRVSNNMTDFFGLSEPSEDRRNIVLNVLYPPQFENITNQKVTEGHNFSIVCAKPGNPTSQSWKWRVGESNRTYDSNILSFTNITRREDNNYSCQLIYTIEPTYGNSTNSSSSMAFRLEILYPPENINITMNGKLMTLKDVTVIENVTMDITLECLASGNPLPTNYSWDGSRSSKTENILFKAIRNNSGIYICKAENELKPTLGEPTTGQRNKTFSVNFLYPPTVKNPENVTRQEGENINKPCLESNGTVSSLTVFWQSPDGRPRWDNYLWIQHLSSNATGVYTCTVNYTLSPTIGENISGTVVTKLFVVVQEKGAPEGNEGGGGSATGAAIGGALGGLAAVLATVAAVYLFRKRRAFNQPVKGLKGPEYENVFILPDKKEKTLPTSPAQEEPGEVVDISTNAFEQDVSDSDKITYVNTLELGEIKTISVSKLSTYVSNRSQGYFFEEFEKLPKGGLSSIPCTFARKPENVALNRYQGIYPYDHSRVMIVGQPDFFINANYINGFKRDRQYIASLGPTKRHTLGFKTFWDMVWHEQSDVIVMLTNLAEPSGMKCEKYWADFGKTIDVGDFLIKSETEEVTAEYTVRTFCVSKENMSRFVTQLHYTAWPDKTVPDSVTSLIDFRLRVKAAPTHSHGPVIVHCSAGIGRTGTYIALDRLIEEGKSTGFVNVFNCVTDMRQQRVNMVQTLEQYVYLHQALVYCLTFHIEPFTDDAIREYTQTASNNAFSQMYQELKQTVEKETEEYLEARRRHESFFELNRRKADIPGDRHRVLLSLDKAFGDSNYINAVYLSSFLRLDHFIIAQSPVPKTVDDFVGMLYQAKSICIVSMDDYRQKGADNVTYLPAEEEQLTYGLFTISCLSIDVRPAYIIRKVKLGHAGKHEQGERIAYHFEFTAWRYDERLPNDPKMFLEFIREVEEFSIRLKEKESHVVIHCMSGSERSGLFCAVSNLVQKMELEKQVSVVNTLRRVRERRKMAIPSMEQMKFCYQALDSFVKQSLQQRSQEKFSMVHYENNAD